MHRTVRMNGGSGQQPPIEPPDSMASPRSVSFSKSLHTFSLMGWTGFPHSRLKGPNEQVFLLPGLG